MLIYHLQEYMQGEKHRLCFIAFTNASGHAKCLSCLAYQFSDKDKNALNRSQNYVHKTENVYSILSYVYSAIVLSNVSPGSVFTYMYSVFCGFTRLFNCYVYF